MPKLGKLKVRDFTEEMLNQPDLEQRSGSAGRKAPGYTHQPPAPVSTPTPKLNTKTNINPYLLIGAAFCWVAGSVFPGLFGWILIGISLILGLFFIFTLLPEELRTEISDFFEI